MGIPTGLRNFVVIGFGSIAILVIVILSLGPLQSIGVFSSATQNSIASAQTGLNDAFPFMVMLIVGGGSVAAWASR